MRRIALLATTALAVLACGLLPSGALANRDNHHWGRHHHARRAGHHHHFRVAGGLLGGSAGGAQQSGGGSTGTETLSGMPGNPQGNAGTIVSFTAGVLTVKVGEGETATTISGKVDEQTEIHCIPAPTATTSAPMSNVARASDNGGWGDGGPGAQSGGESGRRSDEGQNGQAGDEPGMGHDDQGPGDDDRGDRNNEGDPHCQCTTANLTPGTIVHRAELLLDGAGATFREVVLVA